MLTASSAFVVELGVVIGRGGANISQERASSHIAGYALALDLTARNLQVRSCRCIVAPLPRLSNFLFRMRPSKMDCHGRWPKDLTHFVR